MSARLPSYDELPVDPRHPAGSSWGLWGDDDVLGCLNLLTPEAVRRGLAAAIEGRVFPLNLPLHEPDPPLAGRSPFSHDVSWVADGAGHDEEISGYNTQSSSQWDGFRHVRHLRHGFYGGLEDQRHGVGHWARHGIAGRAVLADVGRHRADAGRPLDMTRADPIEPSDVVATLSAQGSTVVPGDILLVRTGWLGWYRTLEPRDRQALAEGYAAPGLRPGTDSARLLWDLHVAAVAADNPALEAWPPGKLATPEQRQAMRDDPAAVVDVSLHFSLLPLLGMPIGELWDLDDLAEECAVTGRYESLLTSSPLPLDGGVASPANAMAIR